MDDTTAVGRIARRMKQDVDKSFSESPASGMGFYYTLPIGRLDDVAVECQISVHENTGFRLYINSSWLEEDSYTCENWNFNSFLLLKSTNDFTVDTYAHALIKAQEILSCLRFSVYRGKFVRTDKCNFSMFETEGEDFNAVFSGEYINLTHDECSVCMAPTTTQTSCQHPLCFRCWERIRQEKSRTTSTCPLCRKNIQYVNGATD